MMIPSAFLAPPSVAISSGSRKSLELPRPFCTRPTTPFPHWCSPSMSLSGKPTSSTVPTVKPSARDSLLAAFHNWFSLMPGVWNSERTYHYFDVAGIGSGGREASQTTFEVARLTSSEINAVLSANKVTSEGAASASETEGMRVSFRTRMRGREGREEEEVYVMSSTDLVMSVNRVDLEKGKLMGDYYRSVGYEEPGPKTATCVFDVERMEMTLITWYEKVVSVDRISLLSDVLRTRNIVNYVRPKSGKLADLKTAVLCGFGIEAKGAPGERLVV